MTKFTVVRNLGFEARDGEKYLRSHDTLEQALEQARKLERKSLRNTYHVVQDDNVWSTSGSERR
jgi:hypothetical protein